MSTQQTRSKLWLGCAILVVAFLLTAGLTANDVQALQSTMCSAAPGVQGPLIPRAWLPLVMKSPQFMTCIPHIAVRVSVAVWAGVC